MGPTEQDSTPALLQPQKKLKFITETFSSLRLSGCDKGSRQQPLTKMQGPLHEALFPLAREQDLDRRQFIPLKEEPTPGTRGLAIFGPLEEWNLIQEELASASAPLFGMPFGGVVFLKEHFPALLRCHQHLLSLSKNNQPAAPIDHVAVQAAASEDEEEGGELPHEQSLQKVQDYVQRMMVAFFASNKMHIATDLVGFKCLLKGGPCTTWHADHIHLVTKGVPPLSRVKVSPCDCPTTYCSAYTTGFFWPNSLEFREYHEGSTDLVMSSVSCSFVKNQLLYDPEFRGKHTTNRSAIDGTIYVDALIGPDQFICILFPRSYKEK